MSLNEYDNSYVIKLIKWQDKIPLNTYLKYYYTKQCIETKFYYKIIKGYYFIWMAIRSCQSIIDQNLFGPYYTSSND